MEFVDREDSEEERVSCEEAVLLAGSDVAHSDAGDYHVPDEEDPESMLSGVGDEDVLYGEEGAQASPDTFGELYNEINVDRFEELVISDDIVAAVRDSWKMFASQATSKEAAGEAIYAALFEAAPSLQNLFTSPRVIQAMRFANELAQMLEVLHDPAALKIRVEALGFFHLVLEVTIPRVVVFRDAILDLLQVELGSNLSTDAYTGWRTLLNYCGGAIIHIRTYYADRIKLLEASWKLANDKQSNQNKFATLGSMETPKSQQPARKKVPTPEKSTKKSKSGKAMKSPDKVSRLHDGEDGESNGRSDSMVQKVPTTFKEMFQFNAAVMGFGASAWMTEILACFDNMVSNVSNSARLMEECDVLICRISKVWTGAVRLNDFKTCMLASLRSLLPKDWTTQHEVAWTWLWENVERQLQKHLGRPPIWEKAYAQFLDSIDEATGFQLRKDIYLRFFARCPSGQDYFKQSNTYLHLIATKVLVITLDMYRDPVRMVDDISALGLRHVGYAIPTEYMAPFTSVCVEVVQGLTRDPNCIDGFQWSIGLVSKSLTRTIVEGSTIVMKAINKNTKRSIHKAIEGAPRGSRSQWLLLIQVGTQDISPLAWAIQSGATDSASAIIRDLLTIRADRDKYYYAADDLFARHPDLVHMLLNNAPLLVSEMLDGLVWRSRISVNGQRRVNYYIRHLLIDQEGKSHKSMEWIAKAQDPRLVCHPVLVLLSDRVWTGIAMLSFLYQKSWFLLTLFMFVGSQSIVDKLHPGEVKPDAVRYVLFGTRSLIYVFSLGQMLVHHVSWSCRAYRHYDTDTFKIFGAIPVPKYLDNFQQALNFMLLLCLCVMFAFEPILHCMNDNAGKLFSDVCDAAETYRFFPYSVASMFAMLCYFALLVDLAVINNRVSAYVLVCGQMVQEVGLFLLGACAAVVASSCAFNCLDQNAKGFDNIMRGSLTLWEAFLKVLSEDRHEDLREFPLLLAGLYVFLVGTSLFLVNMLVAQLCCAYGSVYDDIVGYARLKRLRIIVESLPQISQRRWDRFVRSFGFDNRIDFNEGDIGLANGLATVEPASANPTTVEAIKRYGGSTSVEMPWPKDSRGDEDTDRFGRLESIMKKQTQRILKACKGTKQRGGQSSSSMGASGSGSGSHSGSAASSADDSDAGSEPDI